MRLSSLETEDATHELRTRMKAAPDRMPGMIVHGTIDANYGNGDRLCLLTLVGWPTMDMARHFEGIALLC